MEITDEIKYKVALQYWGCNFLSCINIEGNPVIKNFKESEDLYMPDVKNKMHLLILKSLSTITNEDKIGLQEILSVIDGQYCIEALKDKKRYYSASILRSIEVYQYLQSKCYDLPQYLLDGKTLHEAGLCIYEHEITTDNGNNAMEEA